MSQTPVKKYLPLIGNKTARNFRPKEIGSFCGSPQPSVALTQRAIIDDSIVNVFEETNEHIQSEAVSDISAKLEFYKEYKNIERLTEKPSLEELSPTVAYLKQVSTDRLKPKAFGLAKPSATDSKIDLRMFSMGDNYASAFSQGIKHLANLQELNLRSNRLTDTGNEKILNTIDIKQLKCLTLAENKIGLKSLEKLIDILSVYNCKLKYLNLEKAGFTDNLSISLFGVVAYNKRLTKLILASNSISDRVCKTIKETLIVNSTLKVLDLHWNLIRSSGASMIFEGLAENSSLKILDLSWNSIGGDERCSGIIGAALKTNTILAHLDLSYNRLKETDCKLLSEPLKSNHTLLGLHLAGNSCSVDPKGFLLIKKRLKITTSLFYKRIVDKKPNLHEINSNCWICEKWIEQTFLCQSPGKSVFIHLDFEHYRPELMINTGKGSHELTRAVPPRLQKFFFSELEGNPIYSKYSKVETHFEVEVTFYEGMKTRLVLDRLETLEPNGEICCIKNPFFTKPRTIENKYVPPAEKMERIKWNFKNSVFKSYVIDSERLLSECLEFDWKMSRVPNFVKGTEEQEKLKSVLRKHYGLIKTCYKILSAYSGNDIFSIGSNILTDFLNQCKVYDGLYGASDFGVNINSTLVKKDKNQLYNPGNSLVRYEFLEIIVRIAIDRFMRNKICSTYSESVSKLIEEHLLSVISAYSTEKWRNDYYTEEVDLVIKANLGIFECLFRRYSGKYTLPGKKPFMSLEEFRALCLDVGLVGENFATRETDVCFNQAMMTQIDEVYSKRHIEMNFVEMLEALCRAIDLSDAFNSDSVRFNSLIQNRLSGKIENALPWLLKVCPVSFQDDFTLAKADVYTKMMYKIIPRAF